jgi:hypothetical protein
MYCIMFRLTSSHHFDATTMDPALAPGGKNDAAMALAPAPTPFPRLI